VLGFRLKSPSSALLLLLCLLLLLPLFLLLLLYSDFELFKDVTQKDKYHVFSHMCNLDLKKKMT
jgi:hypothetical protein